jgi:hypothetical protein
MKNFYLLLFSLTIIFCFTQSTNAQNKDKPDRLEIGVDALSLFGKNNFPAYSIFGRYLINPEGKKEAFFRTRLGYQSKNKILNSPNENIEYQDLETVSWALALGFQKEILSNSSSSFYYGGDFIYQRKIDDDFGIFKVNDGETFLGRYSYDDLKTFSMNRFVGFLGFSTNPAKQIKISIESGLFAGKTSFQQNFETIYPNGELAATGYNSSIRSIFGIQPFYQILITLTL